MDEQTNLVVRTGPVDLRLERVPRMVANHLAATFLWEVLPADEGGTGGPRAEATWTVSVLTDDVERVRSTRAEREIGFEFGERATSVVEGGRVLVRPARTGGLVEIDPRERRVVVRGARAAGLFVDTYRVLRQLIVTELVRTGHVCLHASAVVRGGRAVAFVGEKGAGKTTYSSRLAVEGWALLANDKLFVRPDGSACHFPEAPAVTAATLRSLPGWQERLTAVRQREPAASELFLDHPPLPDVDAVLRMPGQLKMYFSGREYVDLLGCAYVTSAQVARVVELDARRVARPRQVLDATVDLRRHLEDLETFPDWTTTRPSAVTEPPGLPTARIASAHSVDESLAAAHPFLEGALA